MKLKRSQRMLFYYGSFVVGTGLASWLVISWWWSVGPGFLLLWRKTRVLGFVGLCLMVGVFNYQWQQPIFDDGFIASFANKKIEFHGVVKEVDVRHDQVKLTIAIDKIEGQSAHGNLLVKTALFPAYEYGDTVVGQCKILRPEPIEDFHYDRYLARYNIYAVCYHAQVQIIGEGQGNWLMASLLSVKESIGRQINETIHEPEASLLAGILLGSRRGMPEALMEDFNRTGITHIIAISGYNITIVALMILNLCVRVGINRKKAFKFILVGLLFFVVITGASAAVVRAAIMGSIVLWAKFVGRKSKVALVLGLTVVIMLLINAKVLRDDAGFQLSFLATMGLIYGVPLIEGRFKWVPLTWGLRENLVSTLAATLFTLPLILWQFGRLSIVAPVVNVLVLSFIPLAMAIGFVQLLLAWVWQPLGVIVGWLTWLVLRYVIQVTEVFAAWQYAAVPLRVNLVVSIILYILLMIWVIWLYKRKKRGIVSS